MNLNSDSKFRFKGKELNGLSDIRIGLGSGKELCMQCNPSKFLGECIILAIFRISKFRVLHFATVSLIGPAYSAKVFTHRPLLHHVHWGKQHVISHSSEQDTIVFLISKQATPYRTRGVTCCPGVSTPKIRSLANSSTTCHDGINHLHHSNHCSNHIISPHTVNSHLDGWETTSLTLRRIHTQHHKDERLARHSRLHG
jgi:hypothetical protein